MHIGKWSGLFSILALVAACSSGGGGDDTGSDPAEQKGGKTKPTLCGGFAGLTCPSGKVCVDDPSDDCDPNKGGADCGGICVDEPKPTFCGGFAGFPCPDGLVCVDNPSDDCDPNSDGADCGGICVAK